MQQRERVVVQTLLWGSIAVYTAIELATANAQRSSAPVYALLAIIGALTIYVCVRHRYIQRHRRRRARRVDRIEEESEAGQRARALLLDTLDATQRKDLERHNFFYVRGDKGGLYRLTRYGSPQRVRPKPTYFCVYSVDRVPNDDWVLAQKLLIESDEKLFLSIANPVT